jgi:hypothetical protein
MNNIFTNPYKLSDREFEKLKIERIYAKLGFLATISILVINLI